MTTTKRNEIEKGSVAGLDKYSRDIRLESEKHAWEIAREGHDAIDQRLRELDQEWDIESMLKLQACAFAAKFVLFGSIVSKKYYWGAALVGAAMLQQSIKGWSPPYELYRKLGKRTMREIKEERYALEVFRERFYSV